jgi:hypothetical protein
MNDEYFRFPTDEERRTAAEAWNKWKPGRSGRKSWSPFSRKITRMRDRDGRPLKMNGELDTEQWIKEVNAGEWPRRR